MSSRAGALFTSSRAGPCSSHPGRGPCLRRPVWGPPQFHALVPWCSVWACLSSVGGCWCVLVEGFLSLPALGDSLSAPRGREVRSRTGLDEASSVCSFFRPYGSLWAKHIYLTGLQAFFDNLLCSYAKYPHMSDIIFELIVLCCGPIKIF